jgi:hypothetical protein
MDVSSTKISMGGMLMTVLLIFIFDTLKSETVYKMRLFNIILIIIISLAISKLDVRGVYIGLIFALIPIFSFILNSTKASKHKVYSLSLLVLFISFLIFNVSHDRFKFINDVVNQPQSNNISYTKNFINNMSDITVASRLYYLYFSFNKISNNVLTGLESVSFRQALVVELATDKELTRKIDIHSHAHNEFADIGVKYGLIGLILFSFYLFSTYLFLKRPYESDYRYLGKIVLYTNIGYMLTQSMFMHNQPTTFFILLLYLIIANCQKVNRSPSEQQIS